MGLPVAVARHAHPCEDGEGYQLPLPATARYRPVPLPAAAAAAALVFLPPPARLVTSFQRPAIYIPQPLWAVALTPKQLSLSSLYTSLSTTSAASPFVVSPSLYRHSHPLSFGCCCGGDGDEARIVVWVFLLARRRGAGKEERCAGMLSTGFLEL